MKKARTLYLVPDTRGTAEPVIIIGKVGAIYRVRVLWKNIGNGLDGDFRTHLEADLYATKLRIKEGLPVKDMTGECSDF